MPDIVKLAGIHKRFGGVHALKDVDFDLSPGEVHALVGENGAGKSTLMKVLGGEYPPTEGRVEIDGTAVAFAKPLDAISKGIAVIHQEMALAGDLTVAENIFIGELTGIINWRDLKRRAAELIARLGFDIPADALAGSLSVAHQQVV
ncbi:MAG: sugar ABC transporter ATP-binding protein, partial [Planctomycetes bacterium]|nr:sugar ABC transporter ATP-binding protein [Planctomycetota bacterium]